MFFLHVCPPTTCMPSAHRGQERESDSPGTGVTSASGSPCGCHLSGSSSPAFHYGLPVATFHSASRPSPWTQAALLVLLVWSLSVSETEKVLVFLTLRTAAYYGGAVQSLTV